MTALVGRWNFDGNPDAGGLCRKMLAAQEIYGPHRGDSWDAGTIALGRQLYEILPEDAFDHQPLSGDNGRFRMVADVRLDNRAELAKALGLSPVDTERMADAGYLIRAWEKWGEDCFDRLLGDYAFALWDDGEQRLILARDPFGGRPIHYHRADGFFAFSSMPKGLHALSDVPYGPDEERVAEFLALLPESGAESFFKDVRRVEPGHVMIVKRDGITSRRHWNPTPASLGKVSTGDAVEGLRHHLDQAVSDRLRGAKGRIGAHLSAGLDSSAVASTAARLLAAQGDRLTAFTSVPRKGYDGRDPRNRFGDEGPLAAMTAALHPNIDHRLIETRLGTPFDTLDRDFFLFERPILNLCNQRWMTAINDEAKKSGAEVMLVGLMGNMTFSYAGLERLHELASGGHLASLWRESRALMAKTDMSWRGAAVQAFGPWMPDFIWKALNKIAGRPLVDLSEYSAIKNECRTALDLDRRAKDRDLDLSYRPRRNGFESRLWVIRRIDHGNYNKGILGGWGIDQRDATCDRRLVEYCLSLPMEAYLANGEIRLLAKQALADRLPAAVINEQRKGLQAIDWHEGLERGRDMVRQELDHLREIPAVDAALDLDRMSAALDTWPSGDWNSDENQARYRLALLRGYSSGHFLRRASRSNA